MKSLLSSLWRWSWVITVPVAVTFLYWADQTWSRYWTFGVRYDSAPIAVGLRSIGEIEAQRLINRGIFELLGEGGQSSLGPGHLRLISLLIREPQLSRLNKNLPHSGFREVKAELHHHDRSIRCKVRYRGDYANHWAFAKKSWRIKTDRNQLFEGMRKFNLISPKFPSQINNYFGYKLAKAMGLISPRCEMVQLAVNGKLQGVHLLVEQIEELTLRHSGYMPGDLYRGELVAKDAFFGAPSNSVFEHPELWDKVSINNHYDPDAKAPLHRLMQLCVATPSAASQEQLLGMLDLEAWARFSVYETLTQCFHFDEAHNWRLYYDANRIRFVPVVWDPVALLPQWRPRQPGGTMLDVVSSRLHELLYQNAEFLRARHKAMVEFFSTGMEKTYIDIAEDIFKRMGSAVENDINRRPSNIEAIAVATLKARQSMDYILADLRQTYLEESGTVRFDKVADGIGIEISGRRPVNQLRIAYHKPPEHVPNVRIRYTMDGSAHDVDVSGACSLSGSELLIQVELLSQLISEISWNGNPMRNHQKACRPAYYELAFSGLANPTDIREILCDRGNGLEVARYEPGRVQPREIRGLFAAVKSNSHRPILHVGGVIEVTQTQEITDDVVVAPGTQFVMHPGASIRFWGRVLAQGNEQQPITFAPKEPEQEPWGVIALQGQKTTGSIFSHCQFQLGSGWKEPLFEYSAMFSVHDSSNVQLHHCRFRDSRVVDDMVHTVYSHVEFHHCQFDNSLMDALDMDISTGKVLACVFRRSGNDSLDLMTSKIVVDNTEIFDSGDKGISVGENTTLLATRLKLIRCAIGIEGKDSSRAFVFNSVFDANKLAINAYKKNWRYGDGGHVEVHYSQFLNTLGSMTADRHSSVLVENSYLDKPVESSHRIRLGQLNDIANQRLVETHERPRVGMPAALRPIEVLVRPHFASINPHRRGVQ